MASSNGDIVSEQVQAVVLAGGLSSRMGQPKHLLRLPGGDTLLQHVIDQIVLGCPKIDQIYVSLRWTDNQREWLSDMTARNNTISIIVVYDDQDDDDDLGTDELRSQGPAAGMLAAHRCHPAATFLVIACDFPLLDSVDIHFLLSSYQAPITCYQNDQGFCEPLFGLWSSAALFQLSQNMSAGLRGPSRVVEQLSGNQISAPLGREASLWNTNTPIEWQEALRLIEQAAKR